MLNAALRPGSESREAQGRFCSTEVSLCRAKEQRLQPTERAALVDNSWFTSLSATMRHELLRSMRVRSYTAEEDIFYAGAPARSLMVCLSGAIRVAMPLSSGRPFTLCFLRPGQWFGDLPTPASCAHSHDASAKVDSQVGEIPLKEMSLLIERYPDFQAALLNLQSMRLATVYRLLEDQATQDLGTRMARLLHRLAKDHGVSEEGSGVRIALPLAQADLAQLAGCSRQRANQQLRALTRRGLVQYTRQAYVIPNPQALQEELHRG